MSFYWKCAQPPPKSSPIAWSTPHDSTCNVIWLFFFLIYFHIFSVIIRFEIEKKLREVRKKNKQKDKQAELLHLKSASQRSQERRKNMESSKDNKKMSALETLKAKREEKRRQGN